MTPWRRHVQFPFSSLVSGPKLFTMPWRAQQCPFCQKRYVNKKGLNTHLSSYIGEWRIPADGKHDVLQIKHLLRQRQSQYRCWTCSKILDSRARFREHVIYHGHCGLNDRQTSVKVKKPSRRDKHEWLLPFGEELAIVKEETFPFLSLPTG